MVVFPKQTKTYCLQIIFSAYHHLRTCTRYWAECYTWLILCILDGMQYAGKDSLYHGAEDDYLFV